MRSFRTELENPLVEKDILELEAKIHAFKGGSLDEERFRTLRLARGVYGQRQFGVQMVRIKVPYGKLNSAQLRRIADVSDEYSTGKLHITTRQDIQIHYVSLDRTPELWAELERDNITLREACGNTVRNVTASELAGIDPHEVFDVRPYADALFRHFLRNPISQELGRKIKIAFSGSDSDSALTFMHDIGFIARKGPNGEHGFKVVVGGGLGTQSQLAEVLFDFLSTDKILPASEAVVRVFEQYGERTRRMKARLKFLIKDIGIEAFKNLVKDELRGLEEFVPINFKEEPVQISSLRSEQPDVTNLGFDNWKKLNVIEQKQKGLYAVGVKVRLGDFSSDQARKIADIAQNYGGDEITFTLRQNLIIRHVKKELLSEVYVRLINIGLAEPGFNRAADVTSCPGTDTCNLGIASSTGLAKEVERIIQTEYADLIPSDDLQIKISGCMNSCGQHMIAHIGFQGMSMKAPDGRVLPATQVLLGGGIGQDGVARFADKVIKVPAKRTDEAVRILLDDYAGWSGDFLSYYQDRGDRYFYELLKPLTGLDDLNDDDFVDWGSDSTYFKAVGVGECAGVVIDLVTTLLFESEEKVELAKEALHGGSVKDSIYHSYQSIINTAKALLIGGEYKTNTHNAIIDQFQEHFLDSGKIQGIENFREWVLTPKNQKPNQQVAQKYIVDSLWFLNQAKQTRQLTEKKNLV